MNLTSPIEAKVPVNPAIAVRPLPTAVHDKDIIVNNYKYHFPSLG